MRDQAASLALGIDVGSTTVKASLTRIGNDRVKVLSSAYVRHDANLGPALRSIIDEIADAVGDAPLSVILTGSVGMGLAERAGLPFVQEVQAAAAYATYRYPTAQALLDIGGEDSKLVFFETDRRIDARMNGGCAGGTGAFLDQMAAVLSVETGDLDRLAAAGRQVHPIAMRCGVFAKTDVQNLLSTGVPKADVALSVFHAVTNQVISTLTHGRKPTGPVVMTGGPLTFLPALRRVFGEKLGLSPECVISPDEGALAAAEGAALTTTPSAAVFRLSEIVSRLSAATSPSELSAGDPPLFADAQEFKSWSATRFTPVGRVLPAEAGEELFLGIDSGSTTTKLVIIDRTGCIVADHYRMNHGEPIEAVQAGLRQILDAFGPQRQPVIRAAAVTGYGENLIRAGLGINFGVVETEAHLRAARMLASDVSFVLDIGGQDMKALFVRDGQVRRVEVNEACSSGCGSFLQTFAEALSLSMQELSAAACRSRSPRALGSRCTVFMNSMVKQALREGAKLEDIAAGLAYSVARNCLQKVLKLRDYAPLGDRIVAQGGTFLNPAVHRAFELLIGHRIICPDAAGLSGAWGAALWARDNASESKSAPKALESFTDPVTCTKREARCKGCSNGCAVTLLKFEGAGCHVAGNRCERYFHNGRRAERRGINHMAAELSLLLDRPLRPVDSPPRMRIGLPLALNMFENLPFWTTLFVRLGHEVLLSKPTDASMVETAIDTFCSDSVCLPARVSGAHVAQLQAMNPDVVFFPNVFYEEARRGVRRNFNCPIVAGYPEVTAAAMTGNPRYRVPVATPPISFESQAAQKSTVRRALEIAQIDAPNFEQAFDAAWQEYARFKERRLQLGIHAIEQAEREKRKLVVLACRSYHLDAYLNRGVPEMLADLGYDVVSSQCLPQRSDICQTQVLPQWSYPNHAIDAAFRAAESKNIEFIQLTSFGCGPDAIVLDEVAALLDSRGKSHMALRVDESTASGSIRLRLRTLDMNVRAAANCTPTARISTPPYLPSDRHRTFITASMDPWLFSVLVPELRRLGYRIELPAKTDRQSLDLGLRYVNNEVCYPAILTIGDILKTLESHRQRQSEVAVLLTQTGGQCRASNYAPLLKKAMVSAGFADVPVVTLRLAVGDPLNEQPGFTYNGLDAVKLGMQTLVVTDTLRMTVNALAPREKNRGQAQHVAENLVREWTAQTRGGFHAALEFVKHACRIMSTVPTTARSIPRVGIVGEIYVKYSGFANHNIIPWLVDQGVEPVVPPILNYFTQGPMNVLAEHDARLDRQVLVPLGAALVDKAVSHFLQAVNRRLEQFPFPVRFPIPREIATKAAQALSLTHQYGEGWGIAGEILEMADQGVRKVVCLQPFGCIANQVVARGIERRLRAIHPDLQLLYLDLDHNVSEANLFNRLRLLIAPPARISVNHLQAGSVSTASIENEFIHLADTQQSASRLAEVN